MVRLELFASISKNKFYLENIFLDILGNCISGLLFRG